MLSTAPHSRSSSSSVVRVGSRPGCGVQIEKWRLELLDELPPHIEETGGAGTAQKLASGSGEHVAADLADPDRELADGLAGVQQVRHAGGPGHRSDRGRRVDQPTLGRDVSDGDQPDPLIEHALESQPDQPSTIAALQALLDRFLAEHNQHRPHRSLPHRATPATIYTSRPKTTPDTGLAPPTPTTGSAMTGSTPPARSRCATKAASTASASAEPTPEPASSCSSGTSTSASSTPPPANPSANSPSTHPSATKAPPPRAPDAKWQTAEPTTIGFGRPRCPETSHGRADRI